MVTSVEEPRFILGPVLYFRGEQGDRWWLSALFVIDGDTEPADLRVDGVGLAVPPRHVAAWRGRHLWRFDFAVPRGATDGEATYGFEGAEQRWSVAIPARGGTPRMAFTACNGTEHEHVHPGGTAQRNALWSELAAQHARTPFHILLQGGNQIYADTVWRDCPSLRSWRRRKAPARLAKPFTAAMAEEAMGYYVDHYIAVWAQPEIAAVLARIPSVMMWDDHDVFDGWGSLEEREQNAPVLRGVAMVARRAFTLFQLAGTPESLPACVWGAEHGSFAQGFRIGDVGLLAPDLRSDRTPTHILSERTWQALPAWLERFQGCRHLLLLSSVPLLFSDIGRGERLVRRLPGTRSLHDDLRDQWRSRAHVEEWRRMLELLTGFSLRSGCRITSVSGEVHFGARAVLHAGGVEMWQLISSGIVHPPPGRLVGAALEWFAARGDAPFPGWSLAMPPFTETGRRLIRARNWLALHLDRKNQLHAQWHVEGRPNRYLQMI
ncbi:MAG TPA: alkaline phosphatase D family protein [Azospirillum sp.]|nr:alkaline phosphatase D family protein [Azospirillum sp.]